MSRNCDTDALYRRNDLHRRFCITIFAGCARLNGFRSHTGDLIPLTDRFDNDEIQPVFNLHVDRSHTYFVYLPGSQGSVLVHNTSKVANWETIHGEDLATDTSKPRIEAIRSYFVALHLRDNPGATSWGYDKLVQAKDMVFAGGMGFAGGFLLCRWPDAC